VFLIHRRDTLRVTKIMAERALHHPKDTAAAVLNDRVLQATCNYQPRVRDLFWRRLFKITVEAVMRNDDQGYNPA
jgi:hypothetical protein